MRGLKGEEVGSVADLMVEQYRNNSLYSETFKDILDLT